MTPTARLKVWVVLAAALLAGQLFWIFLLHGNRLPGNLSILIGGQIALGALIVGIALLLRSTPADAIKLKPADSVMLILLGAACLQMASLSLTPSLSNDLVRYETDGRMWLKKVSPYATTPHEFSRDDVFHPEMHTIYPPVSELFFALAASVDGFTAFRSLFAAVVIACTAVMLALLRQQNASAWWAVLFAWNPLVTLEFGGMGHQDVLGALFLLLMLLCMTKRQDRAAGIMLALAAGVKPFVLLLWPLLYVKSRRGAIACIVALAFVYLPMLYQHGYLGWLATIKTYGTQWEFNGASHELIKLIFGCGPTGWEAQHAKEASRALAMIGPLIIALLAARRNVDFVTGAYWIMLAQLLLSPVLYPWYLVWCLMFVPLLKGRGWATLALTSLAGVSYVVLRSPEWFVPWPYMLLEYLPVYVLLAWEIFTHARSESPSFG